MCVVSVVVGVVYFKDVEVVLIVELDGLCDYIDVE